ncbi:catalase [Aromatoleum diolicum]|uniref:Catalase n=1 Tax=Aromatoleum diolicum TaxID=75796 RepID=A0ABX1QCZ4_9RHOO|nr:catalase [Aromatoleum diolicum]NMG76239.1 catalase [Aromatoleum diolicum]
MLDPDDSLYLHEQYKFGSREKEHAEFEDHVRRVLDAQKALAAEHSPGNPKRVFHAKSHACLAGSLRLLEDRPQITRQGIFGENAKAAYSVLARFSGGVGFDQHDLKPDVRGLALKIFGVADDTTAADTQVARTVDFLMTNSTNPFGKDHDEFVQFMEASLASAQFIGFLIRHPKVARLLIKASFRSIPSLATEQYWSGHAYLLGPRQAMKFNVRPIADGPADFGDELRQENEILQSSLGAVGDKLSDQLTHWFEARGERHSKVNPDYLSLELRDRLRRGPIKFVFSVQLEKDPQTTPIEDALVEWKESDSPSIPVAELVLDREIEPHVCEVARFTPGHCIPEHRPLGNMGRGRLFAYDASQRGRHAATEEEIEQTLFTGRVASRITDEG